MATARTSNDVFLHLPFRRSENNSPDWRLLEKHIKQQHPSNWNTSIQAAVSRLGELKKTITSICREDSKIPPNEAFVETALKPYITLILFAQIHLPLSNGTVKGLVFDWRDSLDDSIKHHSPNSNVEVWSCLFNLGAALAYVASVDAHSGVTEHIKRAYQTYQTAAGAYQLAEYFLKRLPPAGLIRDATSDSVGVFMKICLAQAHHCGYLKALSEGTCKHGLKAKLAATGSKMYESLSALVRSMSWPKGSTLKNIDSYVTNMQHALAARAEMHLGDASYEEQEIGDAVARFTMAYAACEHFSKMSWSAANQFLDDVKAQVASRKKKATTENDTVYFARVPKQLSPCEPLERPLGKPTNMESLIRVRTGRDTDPFFGIVPAHVAQVASLHFARVQEKVSLASRLVTTYREKVRNTTSSLGVAGAIESLSNETKDRAKIPEPLRGKIVSLKGGSLQETKLIDNLLADVQQLGELNDAVVKRVAEVLKELTTEAEEDARKEKDYGTLVWRKYCKPSGSVPEIAEISRAVLALKTNMSQSLEVPLTSVKSTLQLKIRELCRLDFCLEDLDALMPFTKTKKVEQQTQVVVQAIENLKTLQQRLSGVEETLESTLEEANKCLQSDDVVHTLSAVEPEMHDAILEDAMLGINDIVMKVQSETAGGEKILDSLQESMLQLATTQSEDPLATEIQQVLTMLELALHTYMSLRQDATTAATCAAQLLERGEGLLQHAQSYHVARSLEASDITEALDREIAQKISLQLDEEEANKNRAAMKRELEELERQQNEKAQQRAAQAVAATVPPPSTIPTGATAPVESPRPPQVQQQPPTPPQAQNQPPPQQQPPTPPQAQNQPPPQQQPQYQQYPPPQQPQYYPQYPPPPHGYYPQPYQQPPPQGYYPYPPGPQPQQFPPQQPQQYPPQPQWGSAPPPGYQPYAYPPPPAGPSSGQ